ncbi:peptidylprolyl isomerase [Pararhizobium haloflavum]|uniref:peptidylprolyl isomerase n=1 Tax=Pararhizobium haloflavum TaxID=2037914 RepID=UPI000C1803FE|nr:peptidylprolyl isomerase [Pararhizobium haloflavum]
MRTIFVKTAALLITGLAATASFTVLAQDAENRLVIELESGEVVVELLPDVAPEHVARVKELAEAGEYDNVAFHRVIDGFMAQTGDVEFGDLTDGYVAPRAGTGGSSLPDLEAEFSDIPFERGTLGMARAQDPNSANSQFFIMFDEGAFLNGQYTVFGQVAEGMEHVDALKKGDAAANGAVDNPDRMISVRVE